MCILGRSAKGRESMAKRGAQVAIRRSHAIQCSYASPNTGWDFSGDDDGPMGAFGVEPRIEIAANSTAHMLFDNPPHNVIILYHFEQQI